MSPTPSWIGGVSLSATPTVRRVYFGKEEPGGRGAAKLLTHDA